MALYSIRNGFAAGEIAPSLWGRTDLAKYALGASTARNGFINYRGGFSSRAGLAYVGMCKQGAPNSGGTSTNNPPRDITFQYSLNQGYALEFGDEYLRFKSDGAYITESPKNVVSITKANPGVTTITSHGFNNGDWIFGSGIGGMTEFNGLTWIVASKTTNTFTLTDLFGTPINTTLFPAFTSGGTFARIYTVVTPYAAIDLPYLKFTQSANTMSLTCVNQVTGTEYPPYELVRNSPDNWSLTQAIFTASIAAPTGVSVSAQSSTTPDTYYSYVVTAVDAATGEESVASAAASCTNNNISINSGSNTVAWPAVTGASSYNVYASISSYLVPVPVGVEYGYIGSSFGGSFVDTNIIADFTAVPPTHQNPFAPSAIIGVVPTASGSGYNQATTSATITTSTGSGAVIVPIVVGGSVVAFIIRNGGTGYALTDTVTISGAGGSGATATLTVGPAIGTFPSAVAYYQQRRVYGNTQNNPDTYYMSQPGAYLNFDSSVPTTDSDAITGTPWAQQINGIQFFQPMPGGLVVLTGSGAWQVNGGTSSAITPADQAANPQAYNGCNNHVGPIVSNYDILYVQAKGSIIRDLSYNFFANIYTGTDLTVLANHLFNGHQINQWAYAEEPYKLIWSVRDDGILLCLTYLKEQDIYAWARSDTNGIFVSVCTVTEPPVDAIYTIVKRYVRGNWVYYSERMDNRIWANVEQCFCVDSGLAYPMSYPVATLTPAAATGTNNISSTLQINGGLGYINPQIEAVDSAGVGTGATFSYTLGAGGSIGSITPVTQGEDYTEGTTSILITDAIGTGAKFQPIITNIVAFTTSTSVFTSGMVGNVIRGGGGQAIITSYVSSTEVMANITHPITQTVPNDPNNMPIPLTQTPVGLLPPVSSTWSISTPTSVVTGLNHLEGLNVSILADGSVVPNQTVTNGSIILPQRYSQITIGLPFLVQCQTLYDDSKEGQVQTVQGRRKRSPAVVLRVNDSRGWSVGTNQPDSSVQPNNAVIPWTNMAEVKERNASVHAGNSIPLFTGDVYQTVSGTWDRKGQIAVQQSYPLPLNLLAIVSLTEVGDNAGVGR